ncbi:MAG: hypothetical protein ACI4L7_03340 [Christensenellales bacterium]
MGNEEKESKNNTILCKYDEIFDCYGENNLTNFAFPLYLFTMRLYDCLEKTDTHDVLFMSREGQFLKKLFERYCEIRKELNKDVANIRTHYFYGSRNSVFTASTKPLQEEHFDYLFRFFNYFMNARKFLISIGFSKEQVEQVKQSFGDKLDKTCFNLKKSKIFKELRENKDFVEIYESNRKLQSQSFDLYMKSFGVDYKKDGLVFVDIGYHGTMQDLIFKFFDNKVKICGYFLKSRAEQNLDNQKFGLLGDSNNKKLFGSKITKYDSFNYEQILRADHGRCLGYSVENDSVNPILDVADDKIVYDKYVKDLQDKIFEKFEKIAYQSLNQDNKNIPEICVVYYYNTIKNKQNKDYKWLLDMEDNHHDDFGYVGYPGKVVARSIRKFAFKLKDKFFVLKNKHYIKKLKKYLIENEK